MCATDIYFSNRSHTWKNVYSPTFLSAKYSDKKLSLQTSQLWDLLHGLVQIDPNFHDLLSQFFRMGSCKSRKRQVMQIQMKKGTSWYIFIHREKKILTIKLPLKNQTLDLLNDLNVLQYIIYSFSCIIQQNLDVEKMMPLACSCFNLFRTSSLFIIKSPL